MDHIRDELLKASEDAWLLVKSTLLSGKLWNVMVDPSDKQLRRKICQTQMKEVEK